MSYITEKKTFHRICFMFKPFSRTSYLTIYSGSKLASLHRVKERKPLNLRPVVTLFPCHKVAGSGKSLSKNPLTKAVMPSNLVTIVTFELSPDSRVVVQPREGRPLRFNIKGNSLNQRIIWGYRQFQSASHHISLPLLIPCCNITRSRR